MATVLAEMSDCILLDNLLLQLVAPSCQICPWHDGDSYIAGLINLLVSIIDFFTVPLLSVPTKRNRLETFCCCCSKR